MYNFIKALTILGIISTANTKSAEVYIDGAKGEVSDYFIINRDSSSTISSVSRVGNFPTFSKETTIRLVISNDSLPNAQSNSVFEGAFKFQENCNFELVFTGNLPVNCKYMFKNCSGLVMIDLSQCSRGNLTSVNQMFLNCSKLKTLYAFKELGSAKNNTFGEGMFGGCSSLGIENKYTFEQSDSIYYLTKTTTSTYSNAELVEKLKSDGKIETQTIITNSEMFTDENIDTLSLAVKEETTAYTIDLNGKELRDALVNKVPTMGQYTPLETLNIVGTGRITGDNRGFETATVNIKGNVTIPSPASSMFSATKVVVCAGGILTLGEK